MGTTYSLSASYSPATPDSQVFTSVSGTIQCWDNVPNVSTWTVPTLPQGVVWAALDVYGPAACAIGNDSIASVGLLGLYRFATKLDVCLVVVGLVCATGSGAIGPLETILLCAPEAIRSNAIKLLCLGIATFVLHFTYVVSLSVAALRQGVAMRRAYVESVLCQEIGWFDSRAVGELTTRLSDVSKIQEGISERVGSVFQVVATSIGGWVIAFVTGWKLSLILLSTMPLSVLSMSLFEWVFEKLVVKAQDHYALAGTIAEEFISCVRTVVAFGIQRTAVERYDAELVKTRRMGYTKGFAMGGALGFVSLIMFGTYGLAFWYGSKLAGDVKIVRDSAGAIVEVVRAMDPGKIMTVFFAIMMGIEGIGQLGSLISAIVEARGCAYEVFATIDRLSLIDKRKNEGESADLRGDIEFRNVYFRYPTRPEVEVLRDFSLTVKSGRTVAFVGSSGCGKSTAVSLLERMYDVSPSCGDILIGGVPLRSINIECLRSQIGVVTQEPVLFAKSISENIALGAVGTTSLEDVEKAARRANAHGFISQLPQGYNTLVGERGTQLSGGQKQRIAIARALIRRPQLLIFDEATSALDAESERIVQEAIDEVCRGVTCIIIAHRLSTVRNADMIVAFQSGRVAEAGTHDELMQKKGLYYRLVVKQQLKGDHRKAKKAAVRNENDNTKPSETEEELVAQECMPSSVKFRTVLRAFSLLRPDWPFILGASISSIIDGAVFPVFALIFSGVISELFYIPGDGGNDQEHNRKIAQCGLIEIAGERLTKYLRFESFKAILRQEVGWFDCKENRTGVLTTRLATEATMVHGITGSQLTLLLSMVSSLVWGILVSYSGSWKVALAVSAVVPLMAGALAVDMRIMTEYQLEQKEALEQAGQVAAEAFENPRTVLTTGKEVFFTEEYLKAVKRPLRKGFRAMFLHSIAGGFMDASAMWTSALALWYGGKLVADPAGHVSFDAVLKAQTGVMFGAMSIGQLMAFLPDYGKALAAAHHIFALFDRKPLVPPPLGLAPARPSQDERLVQTREAEVRARTETTVKAIESFVGDIEFRNVCFEYPTRPGLPVLRGLSLRAMPNQTLALVGSSGCGKSTVISILERMYNPTAGEMGLVGQEPVLFGGTIRENIAHGKPGATEEEIITAAKLSNAHGFISSFPAGYDTVVAEKGVTLSGGQKQRIAIARALVRNPRILLLDEATSALDSNSEAVVQEALDRAQQGRTTIVIAHRLSTIVSADQIAVIDGGIVVEYPTPVHTYMDQAAFFSSALFSAPGDTARPLTLPPLPIALRAAPHPAAAAYGAVQQLRVACAAPALDDLRALLSKALGAQSQFPVDWDAAMRATSGLGYPRRSMAEETLERSFREGVDFLRTAGTRYQLSLSAFSQFCVLAPRLDRSVLCVVVTTLSAAASRFASRELAIERLEAEAATHLQRSAAYEEAQRKLADSQAADRERARAAAQRLEAERAWAARELADARLRIRDLEARAGAARQRAGSDEGPSEDCSYTASSPDEPSVPSSACGSPVEPRTAPAALPCPPALAQGGAQGPESPGELLLLGPVPYRSWRLFPRDAVLTSKSYLEFRGINAERIGCHTFGRIVSKMCTACGIGSERLVAYRNPHDLPAIERAFDVWQRQAMEHPQRTLARPAKRSRPVDIPLECAASAYRWAGTGASSARSSEAHPPPKRTRASAGARLLSETASVPVQLLVSDTADQPLQQSPQQQQQQQQQQSLQQQQQRYSAFQTTRL
eukprot:m51a1_g4018 putative multidrug resistance protein 1 (1740) ;mRNA; f:569158-581375